ncbi:DUF4625 domain-containing protein [Ancylomarina euxinus]|nr:DUF4625 domain-containing protein [Ancylomarina euxinus]MCZ4695613.1 DUF4625 domain-containing protein [Ancylomarina euxinus]
MRFNSKLFICLLTFLPLFGFSDVSQIQTDKISPKIILQSPETYFEVKRGKTIHVNAHLQDNYELESYRIVIRKGGISSDQYADAFSTYHLLDADGNALPTILGLKTFQLNLDIKVDDKAVVGDYNLFLYLKDKAGNEKMIERFFNVCCH